MLTVNCHDTPPHIPPPCIIHLQFMYNSTVQLANHTIQSTAHIGEPSDLPKATMVPYCPNSLSAPSTGYSTQPSNPPICMTRARSHPKILWPTPSRTEPGPFWPQGSIFTGYMSKRLTYAPIAWSGDWHRICTAHTQSDSNFFWNSVGARAGHANLQQFRIFST